MTARLARTAHSCGAVWSPLGASIIPGAQKPGLAQRRAGSRSSLRWGWAWGIGSSRPPRRELEPTRAGEGGGGSWRRAPGARRGPSPAVPEAQASPRWPASRGLLCAPLPRGVSGRRDPRLCARSGSHLRATPASRSATAPSTATIAQPRLRPHQARSGSRRSPPPRPPTPAAPASRPLGGLLYADSGSSRGARLPRSRGSPLRRLGRPR